MALARRAWLALSLLLACQEQVSSRTELLVVVDSDLRVSSELDTLTIHATGPGDRDESAAAQLGEGEPPLPRRLALVHEGGPLGPLFLEVEGSRGGEPVLKRTARVSFAPGRTLIVPMHLVRACLSVSCASDETCSEQGCIAVDLPAEELKEWEGRVPTVERVEVDPMDAGLPDAGEPDAMLADASATDASVDGATRSDGGNEAGMCTPMPEQCNRLDDDCDGRIDDGFNLMTDTSNCGRCGNRCGAGERCCTGTCRRVCQ